MSVVQGYYFLSTLHNSTNQNKVTVVNSKANKKMEREENIIVKFVIIYKFITISFYEFKKKITDDLKNV